LVLLVNSFQPLFVLIFGIVLTLLLPRVAKEFSVAQVIAARKGTSTGVKNRLP
jgi:hypothetical protein